jgi:hypothetical protein
MKNSQDLILPASGLRLMSVLIFFTTAQKLPAFPEMKSG